MERLSIALIALPVVFLAIFALPALLIGLVLATLFEMNEHMARHNHIRNSVLHGALDNHADINTMERFGNRVQIVTSDRFPPAGLGGWFGDDPVIYLNSTFEETLTSSEKEAILAHEVAHIEHHDIYRVRLGFYSLRLLILSAISLLIWKSLLHATTATVLLPDLHWNTVFMVLGAISLVQFALTFALARQREYMADRHAALLIDEEEELLNALTALVAHYGMSTKQKPLHRHIFSTHPSMERRVKRLEELVHSLDS